MWQEFRNNWILFLDDAYFAWRTVVDSASCFIKKFFPDPPTEEQIRFVRAISNDVKRVL